MGKRRVGGPEFRSCSIRGCAVSLCEVPENMGLSTKVSERDRGSHSSALDGDMIQARVQELGINRR